jgi:hypothetical protein
VDEFLFFGLTAICLLLVLLPFAKGGQKWAIVSFFGSMLALLVAAQVASDGSITPSYAAACAGITCYSPPAQSINLPITVLLFVALLGFFVTIGRGLDRI